jgi:CheY-like chemotaxis protein
MIRIVIAEDQAMVAGALAALLAIERDLEVVGTASNGREALELIRRLRPDVLLTDIEMPQMTGLELATAPSRLVRRATCSRTRRPRSWRRPFVGFTPVAGRSMPRWLPRHGRRTIR